MVIPEIPDFPQAPVLRPEQLPARLRHPTAVVLTDKDAYPLLLHLAEEAGPHLLVPECWQKLLPQAGTLISSAISGGSFRQRLKEACSAAPQRCWLLVEPISMRFLLPCPTGIGQEVQPPHGTGVYSDALCCYYTHQSKEPTGSVTLYDTEETIRTKLQLAKEAGFLGYVLACKIDNPRTP